MKLFKAEALRVLKHHPKLAFSEDYHNNYAIRLLAKQKTAFLSGKKYGFWKKLSYIYLSKLLTIN